MSRKAESLGGRPLGRKVEPGVQGRPAALGDPAEAARGPAQPLRLTRRVLGRSIEVWVLPLDDGFHVLVAGGDRSHVGAVSGAGYPAGRARDAGKAEGGPEGAGGRRNAGATGESAPRPLLLPQTLAFGTHKEGAITEKWAVELAACWGAPCTVACGIHYEGLSREGIGQVMAACDGILEELKKGIR